MIQCIYCKGEYKHKIEHRVLNVLGIIDLKLDNLDIFVCDGCKREIFPESTVKEIERIKEDYFSRTAEQQVPVFV